MTERDHAYQGSDWPEHEDRLVGNRVGLERLRRAIDEALEKGESDIDAGEFLGVRVLDDEFFEKNQSENGKGSIIVIILVTIFILFLMVMGFKDVFLD